jgi:hypothetical protein
LVVFDRCQPTAHPLANTLYIGSLPPGQAWKARPAVEGPQIIDVERGHPLMQLLDLGDVLLASATPLEAPEGGSTLLDSNAGPLLAIAPREGYEDAVLGVEIFNPERVSTNWPLRVSFPTFVLNLLEYLGGSRDALAQGGARPGRPTSFRLETAAKSLAVVLPDGRQVTVPRGTRNEFVVTDTAQTGIYEVREGAELRGRFAVNLFDSEESNIAPRTQVKLGDVEVTGRSEWAPGRRDAWKWLAAAALVVLLIEWYIYNRRVYL